MSTRWRRSRGEECGGAMDCYVERDRPLQEIWPRCELDRPGVRPLLRCATHALGPIPPDLPGPVEHPPATRSTPAAAIARPMVPLRKIARDRLPFDGRMAAAGKDQD